MIEVRQARAVDAELIVGFIRGLADYERLLHEVKIRPDDVARDLFGPRAHAHFCDIAEQDGQPVGFALWFYNYSTFEGAFGLYLEDLFVVPEARGTGAGLALMRRLAQRCRDEGLKRVEWAVLDWNAPTIAFYDRLGAAAKTEWITRQLAGDALARLAEEGSPMTYIARCCCQACPNSSSRASRSSTPSATAATANAAPAAPSAGRPTSPDAAIVSQRGELARYHVATTDAVRVLPPPAARPSTGPPPASCPPARAIAGSCAHRNPPAGTAHPHRQRRPTLRVADPPTHLVRRAVGASVLIAL